MIYIRQNDFIIFENIVHIRFHTKNIFQQNRIIFINKNHTSKTNVFKKVIFILQSVINKTHYFFKNFVKLIFENDNTKKLCLIKNKNLRCKINSIIRHVDVYFDRKYDVNKNKTMYENDKYFIKRVINLNFHIVRSLQYIHSTKKKLKI